MKTKKLYRSCDDRIIAGIAGGLAEYLEIDSTIIRLIFLILIFSGAGLVAYLIGWILIPQNPNCSNPKDSSDEIREKAETVAKDLNSQIKNGDSGLRIVAGAFILGLGIMLLFQNIVGDYVWKVFWPATLILVGFYFIAKSNNK